jgi:hypothetical protein
MTPAEREKQRHDIILEGQVVKKKFTKKELSERLLTCGITMKGKLADLQRAATNHGLPIEEISQKVQKGWEGKPKGLLQVLWERGWVDNSNGRALYYYTISGRKNEFNLVQPKTSLKHLMGSCCDFEEEETMYTIVAFSFHPATSRVLT